MTQNNEELKKEEEFFEKEKETEIKPNETKSEIELLKEELAESKDKYIRTLAEAENTRKRLEKNQIDIAKFAVSDFAKDLIPVLDIFKKAFEGINENTIEDPSVKSFLEGIKMTEKLLEKSFNKFGIIEINPMGEKLDPNFHETLYAKPEEGIENNTIVEVMELGYKIHDRILRSAKVGIIKN